ncbi:hypothetical protein JCM13304A_00990 [Desulfothermus okinawensis JCM 13304]
MGLKKLKMEMEELFNKLMEQVEEGTIPTMEDVKKFTKLAARLQNFAPDEWSYEAEDFAHLANQLIGAVKTNDLQEIYRLISALDDAKNYCHRSFRDE